MKTARIFTLVALVLTIAACAKSPDSQRFGADDRRSGGLAAGVTTTASGITLNGVVLADSSYQSQFQQEVKDFMAGSVNPDYIGFVSAQATDKTGVFVGGKVELANGQPLTFPVASNTAIAPNSEILVAVYDKFADQLNLSPLPAVYLKSASGYVNGNNVYLKFSDKYGTIVLQGQFDRDKMKLSFAFNTLITYDNKTGYAGNLGDLTIPTCQFFRCQ